MTLPKPHKDWKLDQIPVTSEAWIGADELLTQLWLRIGYSNMQLERPDSSRSLVIELASKIESESDGFSGFKAGSGIAEAWLRADLIKVFKKNNDEFSVARPVHMPATRLRNTRRDQDSNASAIPYMWLTQFGDGVKEELLAWLKVEEPDLESLGDLPTYALALLGLDEKEDTPIPRTARAGIAPLLCENRGRWYVEDVRAILAYKDLFPRSVLVDHLKRLTRLHIGLHLIQTYNAVADISNNPEATCGCAPDTEEICKWSIPLVADCGNDSTSDISHLAEESWKDCETVIGEYVRAHIRLRKLQEFADSIQNKKKFNLKSIREVSKIESAATQTALESWSLTRIETLVQSSDEESKRIRDLERQLDSIGLSPFHIYLNILFEDGERRWFGYHRQVLDSLFAKNERDGTMRWPIGGNKRNRRIWLSPALVETLVLASMVRFDPNSGPITRPQRVDQLIDRLRWRYGFLISEPPTKDENNTEATRLMVQNYGLFRNRLREAGLFVDQSDAFLTQTIRPRVSLG